MTTRFFPEVFRVEREVFQRRASFSGHIKAIISGCPVLSCYVALSAGGSRGSTWQQGQPLGCGPNRRSQAGVGSVFLDLTVWLLEGVCEPTGPHLGLPGQLPALLPRYILQSIHAARPPCFLSGSSALVFN